MKYAHVINNAINELVESDPFTLFVPGYAAQFIEVPDHVQSGWIFSGGNWQQPPAQGQEIPFSVSRRQGRQALLLAEKLALVQPTINAIADVTQRGMAQIYWDDSQEFERNHPTLIALATQIGLTSADLDSLFITAKALP
jgi:hypothetical protein